MLLTPFMFTSSSFMNPYFLFCQLSQRWEGIKIVWNVRIIDGTIMFCHSKGTVSQQLLENQCIPTAIYKEFSGKCMPEKVNTCSAYSTLVIIFLDCTGESIFRHHFSINRTEQIVFGCATTNAHVFRQYLCHLAAQRNRLQFPCFGMTVDHTLVRQRNIPVLNVADCSRAATRID